MPRFLLAFAACALGAGLVRCSAFGAADSGTADDESTEAGSDATSQGVDATDEGMPPVSADASDDGSVQSDPHCPLATRGPRLVWVNDVCMDETEVTNAQYAVYWANRTSDEVRPNYCANIVPQQGNGQQGLQCASQQGPLLPAACVTWCDAWAYCVWAGKRLCAGVGGHSVPFASREGQSDEWMRVCTAGGTQNFPTGSTWDANAGCHTTDDKPTGPVPAAVGCAGPGGVKHLSGNVGEWLDICDETNPTPATALCAVGGETWGYRAPNMAAGQCTAVDNDVRNQIFPDLGFRCCANPRDP